MPDDGGEFDVAHVAALARLRLSPDEETLYRKQLTEILAFVRRLRDVETTGVPATARAQLPPSTERADEVRPSLAADAALRNAPDAIANPRLVRVPKVLG